MEKIIVLEKGQKLEFSFEDLLKYHGVGYPGGVAHAFQVMQRAFPQLDDGKLLERREIELVTAFPGPGGLDAFEMVTRCVTGGRIHVDKDLPEAAGILESPMEDIISGSATEERRWLSPFARALYVRISLRWQETKPHQRKEERDSGNR